MEELIVVMGCSAIRGTMPLYIRQLSAAGIPVHLEDVSDAANLNGGGTLQEKVNYLRRIANRFYKYRRIVVTDAFDVTFYGSREALIARIPNSGLLWGAEKNCYPDPSIARHIPARTPWRFANGGMVCGTPEAFIGWASAAETDRDFNGNMLDQQFLNICVARQSILCRIDDVTNLFFCLFGGYEELEFRSGFPLNTLCQTSPLFIHANGKWSAEEMFEKHKRSMEA